MTDTTQRDGPDPFELTEDITSTINGAAAAGRAIAVAYVGAAGEPHLSLRGSVQVFDPNCLALWSRSAGLPEGLEDNPQLALLYQNLPERTFYRFSGRAHVEHDEMIRNQIFDASPEREQAQDPQRRGAAVIIELDAVEGMTPAGPLRMTRTNSD
jgi:hypothetical protein